MSLLVLFTINFIIIFKHFLNYINNFSFVKLKNNLVNIMLKISGKN